MYSQLDKNHRAARFAGIFLAVGGANCGSNLTLLTPANVPLIISWQQTSLRSHSKRAYSAALTVAFGGIGGIFGSALFMQKEAKQGYPTGIWFTIGVNVATVIATISMTIWMRIQNKKADRGEIVLEEHDDFRFQP